MRLVLAVVVAMTLATRPAEAYIDPGAGSFALQAIIAAVLGVSFALRGFLRRTWERLSSRGRSRPGRRGPAGEGDDLGSVE